MQPITVAAPTRFRIPALPRFRVASWATGIALACLIAGSGVGFLTGWHLGFSQAADRRRQLPNGSFLCQPGPWGDLSYTPFTIAAPDDLLPVRAIEATGTRWLLKGFTADNFVTLLQSTSLTLEQQHALLDPAVLHVRPDGIALTPTPDIVFSLPADAREKFYPILARSPENDSELHFIHINMLDERFSGSGVSGRTINLFKSLCCKRGNYLVFSGLSALLSRLPTYDEKLRFVKALTRQRTMLLRLHVTPATNVEALTQYWAKGSWNTDVHTILQSLAGIQTGTWLNVGMLLPPLPTSQLYCYPNITDNPLNGPPINRDCHWSSLNFFRDVPNPDFGKGDAAFRELKENYYPAPGDPTYGDVVLFSKPDGSIIHSAIYLADDICFTKNGGTVIHPWMLSTIPDLLEQYSFQVDSDQKLTISYYRNKRL